MSVVVYIRILIATPAHDKRIEILPTIVDAVNKIMDNTPDTDYFIVPSTSDKEVIKYCLDNNIRYQTISFDEDTFNKYVRTISFPYGGYDEFYLYKCLHARKMCFEVAIRDLYDYIFFVDSDNLLEPDALNMLLKENRHDISGWYFLRNTNSTSGGREIPNPKNGIYRVTFTGAGCRLIHKDIFTKANYVFSSMTADDMVITKESIRLNHGVWIHPEVYSNHIGGEWTDEARNYRDAHTQQQDL